MLRRPREPDRPAADPVTLAFRKVFTISIWPSMKLSHDHRLELDAVDREILALLQEDCRLALAQIGKRVGLSAPAVMERIKKLEGAGIIRGYQAVVDARRLGLDITAFIGVGISHPNHIDGFLRRIAEFKAVQESHHVTGEHAFLLKVRARDTSALGELLGQINRIEGVTRTETTIALSTHSEGRGIEVPGDSTPPGPALAVTPVTARGRGR